MSEQGVSPQAAPQPAAMVHLYRGLIDRATTWRSRMDTPTNWAIVLSGTVASFTLSDPTHSHAVILLMVLLSCGFWVIESRRYRYYDLWAGWIRLLEADYLAPMLAQNVLTVNQYWHHLITSDMVRPHFKLTQREALARRLQDTYLAIFGFLLLIWLLKLWVHQRQSGLLDAAPFFHRASIGPLPGPVVMVVVLLFYLGLVLLSLTTYRHRYWQAELLARDEAIWKLVRPVAQPVSSRWRTNRKRERQSGDLIED